MRPHLSTARARPVLRRTLFLLFTWLCALPLGARAHADLLLQIEELGKEIGKNPNDPNLYLRRGDLRRAHMEWAEAYADYEHAATLSSQLPMLDLMRGRLFLDSGWPLSARACLDRFLQRQPRHAEGFLLRARALTRLALPLSAAADYDRAIGFSAEPGPDLYIERAQVLAAAGPDYLAPALQGLDDGIAKLGPLVTLQLFAVDVELKTRKYDGALARIERITERSPRKETWLARRGEILKQAGRLREAQQAYQDALTAMQGLPPARRNVPAMAELEKRLRHEIEALGATTPPNPKSVP